MDSFAAPADLVDWLKNGPLQPPSDDVEKQRLLDRATESILFHAGGWDVDVDGNATDPAAILTLKQACCAQVEAWLSTGEAADIETWPLTQQAYQAGDVQTAGPPYKLAWRAWQFLAMGGFVQVVAK